MALVSKNKKKVTWPFQTAPNLPRALISSSSTGLGNRFSFAAIASRSVINQIDFQCETVRAFKVHLWVSVGVGGEAGNSSLELDNELNLDKVIRFQ